MTAPDPTPLRDRLAAVLRTTPSVLMDTPEERARHAETPRNHHVTHHYYWGCAMCRGEVDTLADAVLAVVQPELDQLHADCQSYADLACGAERTRQFHKDDADRYEEQLRAERDRYRSAWLSARRRAEAYSNDIWQVTAERDDAREQLTHALAIAAGKIAREPAVIRVEGPALEATLTTIAVRTAEERADKAEAERDRAMAGVPLICSDERHQAKVRGLEAELDRLRTHHGQVADHAISLDADLAIFREAVSQYSGQLEEARDLMSNAGHNRAHLDDWPDIIPALQELIAERDQLRTVARAAAVLLRATADRPSDPAVLRAAAAAIDELAPKETSS